MAPTLEGNPTSPVQDTLVAVVDATEFKAAQQDPPRPVISRGG
jgi:hypothetical protein